VTRFLSSEGVKTSDILKSKLKHAIRNNSESLLSKGGLLLHENARPHSAAATVEVIRRLNFEFLPHDPNNPGLAPSGYHMFGPLKDALHGRRFASNDEVKDAVHT
jgi:hypothetical protein